MWSLKMKFTPDQQRWCDELPKSVGSPLHFLSFHLMTRNLGTEIDRHGFETISI